MDRPISERRIVGVPMSRWMDGTKVDGQIER